MREHPCERALVRTTVPVVPANLEAIVSVYQQLPEESKRKVLLRTAGILARPLWP